ncbi:MAG TPA: helix-turn-helix domain-containing protein [Chloroflexota bacterium]|nr:helix-turn-helix domain-containing protein [Chloroflexota bacterium]
MSEEVCPVAEAAKLLGDKWTLIILRNLANGPRRFKELEQSGEGVSPSVLAARLRELEERGMVIRTSYNEIPPRVEYRLDVKGLDALPVIEALRVYGSRWLIPSCNQPLHEELANR